MVPLYLDDCIASPHLARALRASGLSVFLPSDVGIKGRDDALHLEKAAELGACLATKNIHDFVKLHGAWQGAGRPHGGILLSEDLKLSDWISRLSRAGHLLSPDMAKDQYFFLSSFASDEVAQAIVASLQNE